MRFKGLGIILSQLKEPKKPKSRLEQYTIPGELAAKILELAFLRGDIKNRVVFDFGCGTGRLAIGAALLGAKRVVGIDSDVEILAMAKANLKLAEKLSKSKISQRIELLRVDVREFNGKCDTVLQNPPFGIKSAISDMSFLKKALECGKVIYSLHRANLRNRRFIKNFLKKRKVKLLGIHTFYFPIPHLFKFHKKPKVRIEVDLYIISSV